MITFVSNDPKLIKGLLTHEDIFAHAFKDSDVTKEEFEPPIGEVIYIIGSIKQPGAIACLHRFDDGLKLHPYILKRFKRHYIDFVKKVILMVNCSVYIEINNNNAALIKIAKIIGFDSIVNNKANNRILMRFDHGIC